MCSTANYFIVTVLLLIMVLVSVSCWTYWNLQWNTTNQHLPFCLAAISCHGQMQANQAVFKCMYRGGAYIWYLHNACCHGKMGTPLK